MKDGDFIRIDYVGRIKGTGEIFDSTEESVAKEKGIYDPRIPYRPLPVIVGGKFVIEGLENELKKMKVGERKKITIRPEHAFGMRDPKLIRIIPLSEFQKRHVSPRPGMTISVDRLMGRIVSVSGGRVKVDFNHPLAGKELEYEVEIKEKISDKKEKVKAIMEFFLKELPEDDAIFIKDDSVEIRSKPEKSIPSVLRQNIAKTLFEWVNDVKTVKFIEEYVK